MTGQKLSFLYASLNFLMGEQFLFIHMSKNANLFLVPIKTNNIKTIQNHPKHCQAKQQHIESAQ